MSSVPTERMTDLLGIIGAMAGVVEVQHIISHRYEAMESEVEAESILCLVHRLIIAINGCLKKF